MDDEVLELTRKCAEALGYGFDKLPHDEHVYCYDAGTLTSTRVFRYDPANDPAQAFELLCWLYRKGTIILDAQTFEFYQGELEDGPLYCQQCDTPAELRLAIMRAVCKVKEMK